MAVPAPSFARVVGYAAVWDVWSEIPDRSGLNSVETVRRGAFTAALRRGNDVPLCIGHDSRRVVARTGDGTLHLEEDDWGLRFVASLPDTRRAREAVRLIRYGKIVGASFKCLGISSKYRDEPGTLMREIIAVGRLDDIALARNPVNRRTFVVLAGPALAPTH